MSSALARLVRLPNLLQAPLSRGIASNPAKSPVSAGEALIGLSSFVVCSLVPAGWVLSNMETYKNRD
ncbi:hypothetical protein XELAEV_18022224mg [Xenopus laevis]|uniref:Cytochrome c oxidase subunit 8A, mitochondrial n=1 Tax=Xenopus laevis TaxID=8355 RepID=A0A974D3W0_XENLA|nr:hypothetical protein XELAEV_18022224mg [Xenopus laevis]